MSVFEPIVSSYGVCASRSTLNHATQEACRSRKETSTGRKFSSAVCRRMSPRRICGTTFQPLARWWRWWSCTTRRKRNREVLLLLLFTPRCPLNHILYIISTYINQATLYYIIFTVHVTCCFLVFKFIYPPPQDWGVGDEPVEVQDSSIFGFLILRFLSIYMRSPFFLEVKFRFNSESNGVSHTRLERGQQCHVMQK